MVEVLHVQRNLYLGFSSADYSEGGNLVLDYNIIPTLDTRDNRPSPYNLEKKLDVFSFRYSLEFNRHSEVMFGVNHSQEQTLEIQPGKNIQNTYTSLWIAAKEKLTLPFKVAIYGYLGLSYNEFNQNIPGSNTGEPITPPELDGLSPIYAAGLEWDLTEDFGLFGEYARIYEQERRVQSRRPKAFAEGFAFGLYVRF